MESSANAASFHEGMFLLTGITGFLGSEVFCRLVRSVGFERVYCMVRKAPKPGSIFYKRLAEHELVGEAAKIRFIETDFSTPESFATALNVAEKKLPVGQKFSVVHMAAIIHAHGPEEKREQQRLNIEVTDELLDWSATFASHFVYISSVVSFGAVWRGGVLRDEDSFPTFPCISKEFSYYTSKRESHIRVAARAKIPVTLLCPGIIHGSLEMEKSSRKHLQYLREGKLKVAPSGSGNFVGLDRVAQSVVQSAMTLPTEKTQTRLLVDANMEFGEYFNLYTRLARSKGYDKASIKVTRLPAFVGILATLIYVAFAKVGVSISLLESLAQGSLHLNFKSKHKQPPTEGIEQNLLKSLS